MLMIDPLLWLTEYPVVAISSVNSSLKSSLPTKKLNADVSSNVINPISIRNDLESDSAVLTVIEPFQSASISGGKSIR